MPAQLRERPIIFSSPMVRAILERRKTQTRRVIKPRPDEVFSGKPIIPCNRLVESAGGQRARITGRSIECPYGQRGSELWVRETWGLHDTQPSDGPENAQIYYRSTDGERHDLRYQKWRPSIFMPRWASRITLAIEGIRVERLQKIKDGDVVQEGVRWNALPTELTSKHGSFARDAFKRLWDSINAKRGFGWKTDPWVWILEFKLM